MELLLTIALGIGLAAACGFRIFVPFMVISVASLGGYLELAPGFDWIGTYPALLLFAIATVIEVAAYYIPWLDNLLDTVATPVAVVAGAVVAASVVSDMSPLLRWTLIAIAGGGMAAAVQTGTVFLRGTSSLLTGGLANFLVSTAELVASLATSLLALFLPLIALLLILLYLIGAGRTRLRRRPRPTP